MSLLEVKAATGGSPPPTSPLLSLPWLLCMVLAMAVAYQQVAHGGSTASCSMRIQQPPFDGADRQHAGAPCQVHQLVGLYSSLGGDRMRAAREVLRRWRLFYPEAPLYIINEGRDAALEAAAREHGAHHVYAPATSDTQTTIFSSVKDAARWMQHLIDAGSMADWVILLEDDVHILKPISFHTLRHDINGDNKDVRLSDELVKVGRQWPAGSIPLEPAAGQRWQLQAATQRLMAAASAQQPPSSLHDLLFFPCHLANLAFLAPYRWLSACAASRWQTGILAAAAAPFSAAASCASWAGRTGASGWPSCWPLPMASSSLTKWSLV